MAQGWDSETASGGGYAPGQNPNFPMMPFKGTIPSTCDLPPIMAPPPFTLIPAGPGLLALPGTALPITYFDSGKCNLIKHLLVDSGDKGQGFSPMKGLVDWIKSGPGPVMAPWDSPANAKEAGRGAATAALRFKSKGGETTAAVTSAAASSSAGAGPSVHYDETVDHECGDCKGAASIVGAADKYSYFGPNGAIPLGETPGRTTLPISAPPAKEVKPVRSSTDWVSSELAKYTKVKPFPGDEEGATPFTHLPNNLLRDGGPPPQDRGGDGAGPQYPKVVNDLLFMTAGDEGAAAADAAGIKIPSPPPLPGAPGGAAGGGSCMFCPLIEIILGLPTLPVMPMPDIPAPFIKFPYAPPIPKIPPPPTPAPPPPDPGQQPPPDDGNPPPGPKDGKKNPSNLPPLPIPDIGAPALQSKPKQNQGGVVAKEDASGGGKCGTCPCERCKPRGSPMIKSIPALQTICETPINYCSRIVCECEKAKPKLPMPKPALPKPPKPPPFELPPAAMMAGLMKAMIPTMMGIPPPGMGVGAGKASAALPLIPLADAIKKDPSVAPGLMPVKLGPGDGKPPSAPPIVHKGPTVIESALCKIRLQQACMKKKQKSIQFGSSYGGDGSSRTSSHGGHDTMFLEFMGIFCGKAEDAQASPCAGSGMSNSAEAAPIDPLKMIQSIVSGQSSEDVEISDAAAAEKVLKTQRKKPKESSCGSYAIMRFQSKSTVDAVLEHFRASAKTTPTVPRPTPLRPPVFVQQQEQQRLAHNRGKKESRRLRHGRGQSREAVAASEGVPACSKEYIKQGGLLSPECRGSFRVRKPTPAEVSRAMCRDGVTSDLGAPRLDPCDLVAFERPDARHVYRVMSVDRKQNTAKLDRDVVSNSELVRGGKRNITVPRDGVKIFKLESLPDRMKDLEKLAREKMRCSSLACIAAIEAREKAVGFDLGGPRSLNGGATLLRRRSHSGDEEDDDSNDDSEGDFVLPAEETAQDCGARTPTIEDDTEDTLSATDAAAVAALGEGVFVAGNFKEYEDMVAPPEGIGWPKVKASTRHDTMDLAGKGGTLAWKNRV